MGPKEVSYSIVLGRVLLGEGTHDMPSLEECAQQFRCRVGGWRRRAGWSGGCKCHLKGGTLMIRVRGAATWTGEGRSPLGQRLRP